MSYELEGTIKAIFDTQTFSKGFTKREVVVTTASDRFPQDIKLEFVKDKVALLDRFQAGQKVKVTFDLRGSEYNGKYFVNLTAWRIHAADETAQPDGGEEQAQGGTRRSYPPRGSNQGGDGGYQNQHQRRQGGGGYQQGGREQPRRQESRPQKPPQEFGEDDYVEDAPPGYPF